MWWAILWALLIGEVSNFPENGGATGGAILAFFVIWYFVHEARQLKKDNAILAGALLQKESQAYD